MEDENKHGGARKGAGRPKKAPKKERLVNLTFSITKEERELFAKNAKGFKKEIQFFRKMCIYLD